MEALERQVQQLRQKLAGAQAQIAKLSMTDRAYWAVETNLENEHKLQEAAAKFDDLVNTFPRSPLVNNAHGRAQAIRDAVAANDSKIEQLKRGLAAVRDPEDALQQSESFQATEKGLTDAQSREVADLVDLYKQKAAAEIALRDAAKGLGIQISDMRSCWSPRESENGENNQPFYRPYLRFDVKNIGEAPITLLDIFAGFRLVDKTEVLGSGEKYFGSSDAPLDPGYKREVFLGSDTGYTGYAILGQRPTVSADLYFEVNGSPKTLVAHVPVFGELKDMGGCSSAND
jgi:hypothetical protein